MENCNSSGEVIGCPIYDNSTEGPLHIAIAIEKVQGYVQCEKLALLDLTVRGYKKIGRIGIHNMMNIADAIQGIFDYI